MVREAYIDIDRLLQPKEYHPMPRKTMTPKQVKTAIVKDRKYRLRVESERFWTWWQAQMDRDRLAPAEAALRAWLARFR